MSHSLRWKKPRPLLPTQESLAIEPPCILFSNGPWGKSIPMRKFKGRLEQQIGTDLHLTILTTNDFLIGVCDWSDQKENTAAIVPLQFERSCMTMEKLVLSGEG